MRPLPLLLLAACAPLLAQNCSSITLSPAGPVYADPGSYTSTVTVSAATGCAWTYSKDVDWISFFEGPPGGQGSGSGSFKWSASPNVFPQQRQGTITVSGTGGSATLTVIQAPPPDCNLSLSPSSISLGANGGGGSFRVQTACYWSASSGVSWIAIPPATGGGSSGPVVYSVEANACESPRTGAVKVQASSIASPAQNFTVTQAGVPAAISVSSTSVTAPYSASDGRLNVSTPQGCGWAATANVSWIHITSGGAGAGDGSFTYHIDENIGAARTGVIQIGSQTVTVAQQASPSPAVKLTGVINSASYAAEPAALSPGEIVALYGANMGPDRGVGGRLNDAATAFLTSIAGTTVLFDGVAVPLTYVSAAQVNAIVPYGATKETSIQVQYQGVQSNVVKMPVQAATPGIFTLDASGRGAGAILNQDYNVNGPLNPAARGSYVMIYGTGCGITNPASEDGVLTTTEFAKLPWLVEKRVAVIIGGVPAEVSYSGGAPTNVAGLTQINAKVPLDVTPGSAVPIVIRIGDWESQPGVTMAVK